MLPDPLPKIIIVTTIIVTMIDNNAFGFNKCYFGIRSGFKKKNFFFLFIHIHMYNWNNYIDTYKREIKSIKSGTHKNNL